MATQVFSYTRASGGVLREVYEGNKWCFEYTVKGDSYMLPSYAIAQEVKGTRNNLWFGYTPKQLLDSGRDIMGEALIANGDPEFDAVRQCLPELTEGAYCFLGGENSQGSLIIDTFGRVYPQASDRDREPQPLFCPETADEQLGVLKPVQCLLDGCLPILFNVYSDGVHNMELLYFVEPGDVCRTPTLWIRVKKYEVSNPLACLLEYHIATSSREAGEGDLYYRKINESLFLGVLADTIAYWVKNAGQGTRMELPEEILSKVATGAMLAMQTTFTAERPHYGHKFYGRELHDNFPPNLIWSLEACCLLGRSALAKRIFDNMLRHIVNDEGNICYRQGSDMVDGAAAAEYGQLLYLAYKYREQLGISGSAVKGSGYITCEYTEKLERLSGMGRMILARFVECPEFGNRKLIKMCAEADNNSRINVYLSNNLWSIRGLRSLDALLRECGLEAEDGFGEASDILERNINELLEEESITDPRFGSLPPFRFGYTAAPYTLSNCRDTFVPVSEAELEKYFGAERRRDDVGIGAQDITENAYANYRYYPESLSSMLLPEKYCDGIVKLKENLGGELLGMIHFRNWLDDWPVMHYARFLLESGRVEKYLLLLYAHTLHHGNPELMCYYEQVRINGEVKAADCVPSLLTTPLLLGWMFSYESVSDGHLMLLHGLPKDWYSKPFRVENLGYTGGRIDIVSDGSCITVDFSEGTPEGAVLAWRGVASLELSDIRQGREFVSKIEGNKIYLKAGIRHAKFCIG